MSELLLRSVELLHRAGPFDVRVVGEQVTEVGPGLAPAPGAEVLAVGGTLLPGLHDHHLHLFATAAARGSVDLRRAGSAAEAIALLRSATPVDGWVRATGYRGDDLDRQALDVVGGAAVRVQHRSGAQWVLNARALELVGAAEATEAGIERAADGTPTGRLHRLDDWLRDRLPARVPDLADLLGDLAGHGVTGVTDMTPYGTEPELTALAEAVGAVAVRPTVVATGGPAVAALGTGPVKVVVDDGAYPSLAELAGWIATAHAAERPVAIHCVTRVALALSLAAWDEVGSRPGDRLEHGAVLPPGSLDDLRRLGITVVTQPAFVAERGDDYLVEVEPDDQPWLYRCGALLAADVPVGFGSDAPYASYDPWAAVQAAVDRQTESGAILGAAERIDARTAIERHLAPLDAPGGAARRVEPGAPADLVLLRQRLPDLLRQPSAAEVHAVWRAGHRLH